jgi:hypothetical protein
MINIIKNNIKPRMTGWSCKHIKLFSPQDDILQSLQHVAVSTCSTSLTDTLLSFKTFEKLFIFCLSSVSVCFLSSKEPLSQVRFPKRYCNHKIATLETFKKKKKPSQLEPLGWRKFEIYMTAS